MNDNRNPHITFFFVHLNNDPDARVIGMISMVYNGFASLPMCTLGDYIVEKEQRYKGIGTALIQAALKKSKRYFKVDCIMLASNPGRGDAHRRYAAFGIVPDTRTTLFCGSTRKRKAPASK